MERAPQASVEGPVRRPAAETVSPVAGVHNDMRPQAAAHRVLAQSIRSSPQITAQRRALQAAFGDAAQLQPDSAEAEVAAPAPAAEPSPATDEDDPPEARARKAQAKAYVDQRLAEPVESGEALLAVLEEARDRFGLSDIWIDMRDPKAPNLGYAASPLWWGYPNKWVGNTLSDYLVWGVYGGLGQARSWLTGPAPTAASPTRVSYGPLTGRGFGSYMLANPLTAVGPAGSTPSVHPPTMDVLIRRKQNIGGASWYYIRGHLLNHNLHGPGNLLENLTPLSQRTNNWSPIGHLDAIEADLKTRVDNGETLAYQVVPKYGRSPLQFPRYLVNAMAYFGAPINDVFAAEDHVPAGLWCKAWAYDANGGRTVIHDLFVPQMQNGVQLADDHYFLDVGGVMIDASNPVTYWPAARAAALFAVAAGLDVAVIAAERLVEGYCRSMNLPVAEFFAAHKYEIGTIVALLATYSTGRGMRENQFPKEAEVT